MTKLIEVVNKAKTSIIADWENNGNVFVDKNNMKKPGILSESMGVTALLVLVNSFAGNKDVFSEEELSRVAEIIKVTISKIDSMYQANGFTADPVVSVKRLVK